MLTRLPTRLLSRSERVNERLRSQLARTFPFKRGERTSRYAWLGDYGFRLVTRLVMRLGNAELRHYRSGKQLRFFHGDRIPHSFFEVVTTGKYRHKRTPPSFRRLIEQLAYVGIETDDPFQYALSANLHRRHLTESQRAMIAAKYMKTMTSEQFEAEKSSETSCANLRKEDVAGQKLNVSGRSVGDASKEFFKC